MGRARVRCKGKSGDPKTPYLPWCWNTSVTAPAGRWLIEFMEKLLARPALHYTLSAWWFANWADVRWHRRLNDRFLRS